MTRPVPELGALAWHCPCTARSLMLHRKSHSITTILPGLIVVLQLAACSTNEEAVSVDERVAQSYPKYLYSGVTPEIPTTAIELRDWQDGRLTHTAANNGHLYIYDATSSRLVYSTYLKRGDEFKFTSDIGRAVVNGRTIFDAGGVSHSYQIYFDSQP